MKIFSVILAATILFLAVKPGIELIPFPELFKKEKCCSTQNNHCSKADNDYAGHLPNSIPKGCCGDEGCDPFRVCCSIALFIPENPCNLVHTPYFTGKSNFSYSSIYQLAFISDFWQPPKFV